MKLTNIINTMPQTKRKGYALYKLYELEKYLETIKDETLEGEDILLTPYYIFKNHKIYELYWLELSVLPVKVINFKEYALKKTGATDFSDIKEEIIEKTKKCYIPYTVQNGGTLVEDILKWIDLVINNIKLREELTNIEIEDIDSSGFYFELF